MGGLSELVVAPAESAEEVLASDDPGRRWTSFAFKGMDNVKFALLLSMICSQSPDAEFTRWLEAVAPAGSEESGTPQVFRFSGEATRRLAEIASLGNDEVEDLAEDLQRVEDFEGWEIAEISELVRQSGDLADTAVLEETALFLWVSP
ncbi:MAG: hypothetical protein IT452_04800 [Planctomycetia bacterium]|nr:hypothetical protein [Planctomycetia bacterium]